MIDEEKIVTPAKCNHDTMAKNSVFIMMMSSQISDDGRDRCSLFQTGSYFRMQNGTKNIFFERLLIEESCKI